RAPRRGRRGARRTGEDGRAELVAASDGRNLVPVRVPLRPGQRGSGNSNEAKRSHQRRASRDRHRLDWYRHVANKRGLPGASSRTPTPRGQLLPQSPPTGDGVRGLPPRAAPPTPGPSKTPRVEPPPPNGSLCRPISSA